MTHQEAVLRDDDDVSAQIAETYRGDIHTIDGDRSRRELDESEEARHNGRFCKEHIEFSCVRQKSEEETAKHSLPAPLEARIRDN